MVHREAYLLWQAPMTCIPTEAQYQRIMRYKRFASTTVQQKICQRKTGMRLNQAARGGRRKFQNFVALTSVQIRIRRIKLGQDLD